VEKKKVGRKGLAQMNRPEKPCVDGKEDVNPNKAVN